MCKWGVFSRDIWQLIFARIEHVTTRNALAACNSNLYNLTTPPVTVLFIINFSFPWPDDSVDYEQPDVGQPDVWDEFCSLHHGLLLEEGKYVVRAEQRGAKFSGNFSEVNVQIHLGSEKTHRVGGWISADNPDLSVFHEMWLRRRNIYLN
jgi:hypothetical protein